MRQLPSLSAQEARNQQMVQYIADMTLELRNMAKTGGHETLMTLLEVAFCEAFALANKVEIPPDEIDKLKRMSEVNQEYKNRT